MSNLKWKFGYRVMAMLMAMFMIVSMMPATVFAEAADLEEESPYKAKNFKAVYDAENDEIDLSWDAFEVDVYDIRLASYGSVSLTQVPVTATSYSCSVSEGGRHNIAIVVFADENDTEGVFSKSVYVGVPYTFTSVAAVAPIEVENNLTIEEIEAELPAKVSVNVDAMGQTKTYDQKVQWNTENVVYDRESTAQQTITIPGVVVPDNTTVRNRNDLPLACSIEVTVKAATDVTITTDLDDSAPVEKKVGESLSLSVAASESAPQYQWYKKTAEETEGTAIAGATSATFTVSSLALTDAAQYYCVVTGRNGVTATSKLATVKVAKNDVNIQLSISPADGQIRPNPVAIDVLNIPADAKGTVQILQGENIIGTFELNGNNSSVGCSFAAVNETDSYVFSATYTGDDKYNSSAAPNVEYDFTKGSFTITKVNGIPNAVKALDEFTVTPVTEVVPESNAAISYSYTVSDTAVAKIDKNGKVTTLKAGKFKITVTALGNDDYNGTVFETADIVVDYADRSGLFFHEDTVEKVYFPEFSYDGMAYTDNSNGGGVFVYSIVSTPSNDILIDQNGKIAYADTVNPFDKDLSGLVGDVVIKLTKQTDGVYKEISDTYTLTITQAEQSEFAFAQSSVEVTYTADAAGVAQTKGQNEATGGFVTAAAVVYSTEDTEIITLNTDTGEFTAIKPGTATVKAEIAGNAFYKKNVAQYTITVNKGTVEGFDFNVTDSEELTTKYGVSFANQAGDKDSNKFGQANSSENISYTICEATESIKNYVGVDANGVVYFSDNCALAADAGEYSVTVQATKSGNDYYNEKPITYTLKITRDAVNPATDFQVNGDRIKDATEWYNAGHEKITITPDGRTYTKISENGTDWVDSIQRDADGKHEISFYLRDDMGNSSQISTQTVNYDKTAATAKLSVDDKVWVDFGENVIFGIWKNESKQIKIEAADNLSGIMSIEYYEQNSNFQDATDGITEADIVKDFDWETCEITREGLTASCTVDVELAELTNKKVVVYAKVTDYAGNVSYFRTNGMVFDSIDPSQETVLPAPLIEIELDENTNEGLYSGKVGFRLKVNDSNDPLTNEIASGIKDITVTIKGSEKEDYEKVITVKAKESGITSFDSNMVNMAQFDVDGTFVVPAEFESNHLTINVVVRDFAGNEYSNEETPVHLAIDTTDPVIEVRYDDTEGTFCNDRYIGKSRKATIDITELNFANSNVEISVTQDGKPVDIQPNFKAVEKDANGDPIVWRMEIDYTTEDGTDSDFAFDVACTDKAGHGNNGWTGDHREFTIDNKKPVISVVISNDDVKNDKYFAADRKATVTITERNFDEKHDNHEIDWSGLTLSLNGKTLNAPKPKLVESDDSTYKRVYTVEFSDEGDYTFDVKYTDLAGNVADPYTCKSVAYKEFTVDKTAPNLTITGVADKSANNGEVAPVITYSDTNFDKDAVTITLDGVNNGKGLKYAGAYKNTANGQIYTYENFEIVQSVDDIYTLTAKLTDKAGNETEATITFSANRFGSVYDLSGLEDILTKYLRYEEDIVFTETNVDTLDREAIKLKLTKNGTPADLVEGTDYTVKHEGGNGQWSVYTYTVKKALFADDGRYSISIYSEDAAGNVNENIDEAKKAEISFGIDKTKPVIAPVDLANDVQYAVDMKTASIEIKDNLVLQGVQIYLNGKEVEYTVNGETYTFNIPKSNSKQTVTVVAIDAAGNEEPVEIKGFLVNTNIFVRWYNNTPLFVGSIIGFAALALGTAGFIVFGKKKKGGK